MVHPLRMAARQGARLVRGRNTHAGEYRKALRRRKPGLGSGKSEYSAPLRREALQSADRSPTVTVKQDLGRPSSRPLSASSPAPRKSWTIRHTHLSIVIGLIVQASFGIDIRSPGGNRHRRTCCGDRRFRDDHWNSRAKSDFFAWPAEVGGETLIRDIARRVARFDWLQAPPDIAAILYDRHPLP